MTARITRPVTEEELAAAERDYWAAVEVEAAAGAYAGAKATMERAYAQDTLERLRKWWTEEHAHPADGAPA